MPLIERPNNIAQRQTGNDTVTHKTGIGTFSHLIINNTSVPGTIKIFDDINGDGTPMFTLLANSAPAVVGPLDVQFVVGLTVVTSGSEENDVTVVFR